MTLKHITAILVLAGVLASSSIATGQTVIESKTPLRERDVVFVPTRETVATAMLKLAGVTKDDIVYDLGCGDGALVIAAAKLGARAVGVDIDPQRIEEAVARVRAAGVEDRVTLIRGDIFDPSIKIGDATVVTLYLLPRLNERLMPRLKTELKLGARVVSHAFGMGPTWAPDQTEQVDGTSIHLWTIR